MDLQRQKSHKALVKKYRSAFARHNRKVLQMKAEKIHLLEKFSRIVTEKPFVDEPETIVERLVSHYAQVFYFLKAVWRGEVITVPRIAVLIISSLIFYFLFPKSK